MSTNEPSLPGDPWRTPVAPNAQPRVRVALDAMGGDYAPEAPILGAVEALADLPVDILLVGPEEDLRRQVQPRHSRLSRTDGRLSFVHAPEVIEMDEHPMSAVRTKRLASISVGVDLVAKGQADAFVTAGNTGAAMAAAVLRLKRLDGIDRPAMAIPFPTRRGVCLLLDIGASADARAHNLVQFALMGVVYAEQVLGLRDPGVGLLSIGEEETKGNLLVVEAHRRLKDAPLRFVGNVEGKDVPAGAADVVVTDGFVGNVLIKFAEGVSTSIVDIIRSELRSSLWTSVLAAGLRPAFGRVRRRMDYAEWGGAPLLGVNGVCIIAHGRSNPRAIRNAVRVAAESVRHSVVDRIRQGLTAAGARAAAGPDEDGS